MAGKNPVDIAAHHVVDSAAFEFPGGIRIDLPNVLGLQITKYMVLEVIVALVLVAIFVPLARYIATGRAPRGRVWNMFEAMILFMRDEVARPAIGHGADKFVPFILTAFFFVLFCNLFGLVPWMGSPTGSLAVTGVLACFSLVVSVGSGMAKYGTVGFWTGLVPHMDLPKVMAIWLIPMILVIEIIGLLIRHGVLAIRLLANMFAGHLVLGVILSFISVTAGTWLWYGVAPASVLGSVGLNLLELLVAFLQAYIFAFLSALFIGMSVHQH